MCIQPFAGSMFRIAAIRHPSITRFMVIAVHISRSGAPPAPFWMYRPSASATSGESIRTDVTSIVRLAGLSARTPACP